MGVGVGVGVGVFSRYYILRKVNGSLYVHEKQLQIRIGPNYNFFHHAILDEN